MEKLKEGKLLKIKDVIKTEDSRINYISGLIRIAECDNSRTTTEEGYIYNIAELLGATYSEVWNAGDILENGNRTEIHFETKQEKTLFLMQALYMCWLDNDYSDSEREEIIKIGDELGIHPSELAQIESWVKQGIDWMSAGAELLRLE